MIEKGCYYCEHRKEWVCEGWNSKDIRNEFSSISHFTKFTDLLKGHRGNTNNVGCGCSKFTSSKTSKERVIFT